MRRSERFRTQHEELERLAGALLRTLRPSDLAADALPALRALARFTGKLKVHAAMEEDALYPWMCDHDDPDIRAVGQKMRRSVSPIYARFFAYEQKWSPDAVRADTRAFALATVEMLQMLQRRMEHEDRAIYDLLDAREA